MYKFSINALDKLKGCSRLGHANTTALHPGNDEFYLLPFPEDEVQFPAPTSDGS